MITFSDTTSADSIFYQKGKFVGYPHVQGMYPIGQYKDKWNKYTYLFFVTLFREKAINLNFDYVNKFTRESAKEYLLHIKTRKELVEKIYNTIKKIHSYQTFEFAVYNIESPSSEYLDWIEEETKNTY